jgi:HlyD family secretion protein
VAEGDVGRLEVGMKAFFTVDSFPGQRFLGKIRQIRNSATTVQNVVTYDAVIDVDNIDLKLRPGMTANVTVVYAERQKALSVANAALRFRPPSTLTAGSASAAGAASGEAGHRHPKAGANAASDTTEARTLWVMRGGAPQAVSVHAGLTDGTNTEIVDGDVNEGDPVITEATSPDAPAASSSGGMPSMRRLF